MLYLIIAVLSNTFMTFIIRLSEKEKSNRFNVNTFNYLFGGILAYFVIRKESIFSFDGDYKYTLFLAVINAVLYITCLYLMQVNMKKMELLSLLHTTDWGSLSLSLYLSYCLRNILIKCR